MPSFLGSKDVRDTQETIERKLKPQSCLPGVCRLITETQAKQEMVRKA